MSDYIATYRLGNKIFGRRVTATDYLAAVEAAEDIRNDNEQLLGVRVSE